jgi:hypothetical protein
VEFSDYALANLPPAPARLLEVGCGDEGGVTPRLVAVGYDVVAIDPRAPDGPSYRRTTLEAFDDPGPFDAAVAGRVLHHVHPLEPALDKLARLAPLLILDEFASDRIDDRARDWYHRQYWTLVDAGVMPKGPPDLVEWRTMHPDLHPYETLRSALDACFETQDFRWLPYLHRWLDGPETEALEESLIEAGALQAIGFRYVGVVSVGAPRGRA